VSRSLDLHTGASILPVVAPTSYLLYLLTVSPVESANIKAFSKSD